MQEHQSFWSGWEERLSALRNVPPVLKIVWQSGPWVVSLGLVFRLFASLLPVALLAITKLIIDAIVRAVTNHRAVEPRFWWLIVAEFSLAVLGSFLTRVIDYLDALGGSREAAKELKLFGLKDFLTERFTRLSDQIYEENVGLARRRLLAGSLFSLIGTLGYYSAYVYVIWRTVMGALSIGTL